METNDIKNENFSSALLVVSKIKEKYGVNSAEFARIIGKNPTYVNDIKKGKTRRISDDVAGKIIEHWPELSKTWILTGVGDMKTSNIGDIHDNNVGGDLLGNGATKVDGKDNSELWEVIRSQQKTIQELTEQNKMLTQIIANKL